MLALVSSAEKYRCRTDVEMKIPIEVLRNCIALGMVASHLPCMKVASLNLFEAVKIAAPESAAWIIGVAMVHAHAGYDPQAACAFMEKNGISAVKGDPLARAYLALFLIMADRRNEAERVAARVVSDGEDAAAVNLARALLEFELHRKDSHQALATL